MFTIRRILISAATAVTLAAATMPVLGQTSELPLQPGQSQQAEVSKLAAVLQSADAADYDKAFACKRLAVIGTKEAVPALAGLLDDEKFAHYARYGLEPITDPSVDTALRKAMGQLEGKLLIGVINSIGARGDAKAVDALTALLTDSDTPVANAAAAALGRIGGAGSARALAKALKNVKPDSRAAFGDACLACADTLLGQGNPTAAVAMYDTLRKADVPKHLVLAATKGAILARGADGLDLLVEQLESDSDDLFGVGLRTARLLESDKVSATLVGKLDGAGADRKALLLLALADLGDKKALPAVIEAAQSDTAAVRLAAIRGIKKIGDSSALPALLGAVLEDEQISAAAQAALIALPGDGVDDAIVGALEKADGPLLPIMIYVVGSRGIVEAIPALREAAADSNEAISLAAIKALGTTVGIEELGGLIDRMIGSDTSEELAATREAVHATAIRMSDREECAAKMATAIKKAPLESKLFLLEELGIIGGTGALEAVFDSARDPDTEVQDAATRVLGEWMTLDVAPKLLELAKTLENNTFKVRAMRGYIRFPRQFDIPTETRLEMCRTAMAAAERDDERKLVLESLRRNPSPGALELAVEYLTYPKMNTQATVSIIAIGESLVDTEPKLVADAMKVLIEAGANPDKLAQAKALLQKANQ